MAYFMYLQKARRRCSAPSHDPRSRPLSDPEYTVPLGLCGCGCGQETPIATRSWRNCSGNRPPVRKGEHLSYVRGHNRRRTNQPYKVEDRGYKTRCWIWQRTIASNGYAVFMENYKMIYAHRRYYEEYNGVIPEGYQVDHLCRVRCCVNPAHLEATTGAENTYRAAITKVVTGLDNELDTNPYGWITMELKRRGCE
jgi:hypothetical protein